MSVRKHGWEGAERLFVVTGGSEAMRATWINVGTLSPGHICSPWGLSWHMPTILGALSLHCLGSLQWAWVFLKVLKVICLKCADVVMARGQS